MEDPDDADDVDWEEDGSEDELDGTEGERQEEKAISIAIRVGPEPANGKKIKKATKANPVKRVTFTEEDYDVCTQRCQDSVDEILTLGLNLAHAVGSELLGAGLLELVPDTLAPLEQYKRRFDQWIAHIRWMKDTFRLVSMKDMTVEEGRDGSFASDLVHFVLKNRAGSSHQLTQLFAAIMLSLGYKVRLVSTVDLVSCSPQEHPDLYKARWTAAQGDNCTIPFKDRKYAKLGEKHSWLEVLYEPVSVPARTGKTVAVDLEAVVDLTDETDLSPRHISTNTTTIASHTAPSSSAERARWVHVDPVNQRIDLPSHVEEVLRKGRPLQYVIAYELFSQRSSGTSGSSSGSGGSTGCTSTGGGSGSSNSSGGGGKDNTSTGIRVVDVTSTYKRQHHHATRRDKETHALLDSYLASCIQELNANQNTTSNTTNNNTVTKDTGSHGGNRCSGAGSSSSQVNSNLCKTVPVSLQTASTVYEPVDLCSDSEGEGVVDLTDERVAVEQGTSRQNTASSSSGGSVSSSTNDSGTSSYDVRDICSAQNPITFADIAEYDLTDYADEIVDMSDCVQPSSSSSSSGSSGMKRKRNSDMGYDAYDLTSDVFDATTTTNNNGTTSTTTSTDITQLLTTHPLPTKFQDYKDHPVYFLERHMLSEQALHPTARVVAVFKGESVYLQAHKENLRTKLQWRRSLRQVRRGGEPIKVVQRSVRTQNDNGEGGEGGGDGNKTIELRLFGSWQTEKIVVSRFCFSQLFSSLYAW